MRERFPTRSFLAVFCIVTLISLQGCAPNKTSFSTIPNSANALGAPSCTSVLQQSTLNMRILFMVDNSNSTNSTDPQQYYRRQTISTFIGNYASHTNLTYQFSDFSGTSSPYTTNFISNKSGAFFGIAADLQKALNQFSTQSTQNGTPYGGAFADLQSLIQADISALGTTELHSVVFMSDGRPTDLGKDAGDQLQNIQTLSQNLIQLSPGNVSVSTVYFGPESDSQAEQNLITMAKVGQGQYVDTNNLQNGNLDIQDVIQVPGTICTN